MYYMRYFEGKSMFIDEKTGKRYFGKEPDANDVALLGVADNRELGDIQLIRDGCFYISGRKHVIKLTEKAMLFDKKVVFTHNLNAFMGCTDLLFEFAYQVDSYYIVCVHCRYISTGFYVTFCIDSDQKLRFVGVDDAFNVMFAINNDNTLKAKLKLSGYIN